MRLALAVAVVVLALPASAQTPANSKPCKLNAYQQCLVSIGGALNPMTCKVRWHERQWFAAEKCMTAHGGVQQ